MKRLVLGAVAAGVLTVASTLPTSLSPLSNYAISYAAARQASPAAAPSPSDIVATAKQYLGAPYATIGNSPATGFSCIGFVNFVFAQNGVTVPFDIPQAWNSAPHVAQGELMPGDVLFYSDTVFAGLSHVAIYIGDDQMIGADSFAVGVTTDKVSDAYWTAHYTGATRPLALVGTAPQPGSGQPAATATNVSTPVPTQAPVQATAPSGSFLQPLSSAVGIYSGPGYQYTPITTVNTATVLTVVDSQGGWYEVNFANTYGWVSAGDVQTAATTPQPTPQAPVQATAAVTTSNGSGVLFVAQGPLYLRSGPGKGFSTEGSLSIGTRLTVLDLQSHWVHVSTPTGVTGWVALQYVSPTDPTRFQRASTASAAGSRRESGSMARVTASVLNVRAAPNSDASVITILFAGERIQVILHRGAWYQVRLHSGSIGWVSAKWVAMI